LLVIGQCHTKKPSSVMVLVYLWEWYNFTSHSHAGLLSFSIQIPLFSLLSWCKHSAWF